MKKGAIVPVALCAVSLVFIFGVIPAQTKTLKVPGDLEPAVFPTAAMLVIASLSGILFLKEMRQTKSQEKYAFELSDLKFLLSVTAGLGIYIFCVKEVGYYTVTAVFMAGMLRYYDHMRWYKGLIGTGVFLLFCYLLFEVGLRITLPRGFLI